MVRVLLRVTGVILYLRRVKYSVTRRAADSGGWKGTAAAASGTTPAFAFADARDLHDLRMGAGQNLP